MKKFFAGIAVAFLVAMMSLGFTTNAHADYGDGVGDGGGSLPDDVDSGDSGDGSGDGTAGAGTGSGTGSSGAGVLPATGGPQTVLLVGGAALLAVGGVALVATRRQSADES